MGRQFLRSAAWGVLLVAVVLRIMVLAAPAEAFDPAPVVALLEIVIDEQTGDVDAARKCLAVLAGKIQTGELAGEALAKLRPRLDELLARSLAGKPDGPLYLDAALVAASWKNPAAVAAVRRVLAAPEQAEARRLAALAALVAARDEQLPAAVRDVLTEQRNSAALRGAMLVALGRSDEPKLAPVVLEAYAKLEPELQPKAVELLTQRTAWSKALLHAIGGGQIPAAALNANQIRTLLASRDEELVRLVQSKWGAIRTERDPRRELVIAQMRRLVRTTSGDATRGQAVFRRVCGQCHKLHGEGAEVGPDLTGSGRNSFEQLLSNVFDPSLVIGAAYQAVNVRTSDGRVLTGLLAEENAERVVLKVQGGKQEIIPKDEVDVLQVSKLSMMPEDLEKQIPPREIADLFAYIALDRPPSDPQAKLLPDVRAPLPRQSTDPARFTDIVGEAAPGFSCDASGEGGVAVLAEFRGRRGVVRTHPVKAKEPCVLTRQVELPAGKKAKLVLEASHHDGGEWRLVVRADGKLLREEVVGPKTTTAGWAELEVDLTPLAGKSVTLSVENHALGGKPPFAYWGNVEIVGE